MTFRSHEEALNGQESAIRKLITQHLTPGQRDKSERALIELIKEWGPVVHYYPTWHPLVSSGNGCSSLCDPYPHTRPSAETGYLGLDHTVFLKNAFITCPYSPPDTVIDSVERLVQSSVAQITAETLDVELYHRNATPILVKCCWSDSMETDGTIPKRLAVPLMLEQQVPAWRSSKFAETWKTMRPYILGEPHGSRSSLFVNQETGQTLKNIYTALIESGMYGPVYQS